MTTVLFNYFEKVLPPLFIVTRYKCYDDCRDALGQNENAQRDHHDNYSKYPLQKNTIMKGYIWLEHYNNQQDHYQYTQREEHYIMENIRNEKE